MRDIKGYEGIYAITSCGRVWSYSTKRFRKPYVNNGGYLCIDLWKNNKRYHKTIHRLVAEAYIPNPDNLPTVDHIDFDKTNNSVNNLRWMGTENFSRHQSKGDLNV